MLTSSEIKSKVSTLARRYGAKRIFLFGSYARGDANTASDIDLRIDKGQIHGLELGGLQSDLEEALGQQVDLVPSTSLDSDFLHKIQQEEILLYEA